MSDTANVAQHADKRLQMVNGFDLCHLSHRCRASPASLAGRVAHG